MKQDGYHIVSELSHNTLKAAFNKSFARDKAWLGAGHMSARTEKFGEAAWKKRPRSKWIMGDNGKYIEKVIHP